MAEPVEKRAWWERGSTWGALGALLVLVLVLYACTKQSPDEQAAAECRDAAQDAFAGDTTSMEVTFVRREGDGWYVKGTVSETRQGDTSVVRYWDCIDGEITWSSEAA